MKKGPVNKLVYLNGKSTCMTDTNSICCILVFCSCFGKSINLFCCSLFCFVFTVVKI